MPELTLEEMLGLATIMNPGCVVSAGTIDKTRVYVTAPDRLYRVLFSPSLTGSPEQRLQALDVIVAAFEMSDDPFQIAGQTDFQFGQRLYYASLMAEKDGRKPHIDTDPCRDILEAAARALLSQEPKP